MTVSDTTSDARMETMYATPSGVKSRPSMPPSANNGTNTSTTKIVLNTIELRTSLLAS